MDAGKYECYALTENELLGYAFFVKLERDYLLDYLAIVRGKRDLGLGSVFLEKLFHQLKDADSMIVEVEAYVGPGDKGAHSYGNRRTDRTEIQYGPGGYAYVYAIYGMHSCFNVVTAEQEKPEVVLIRALEPVDGIALMQQRRNVNRDVDLCNGPGKLCQAMGITKAQYGCDLCASELWLEPYQTIEQGRILVSPRINIDYAGEYRDQMWRYFIKDHPYVSKVAKRYRDQQKPYR